MAGGRLEPPSLAHWAGTDRLGRDLFTQIMIGSRIALIVGIGAVAIGAAIGVTLGLLAAFATRLARRCAGRHARHPDRLSDAAHRHAGGRRQRHAPASAPPSWRSALRSRPIVARLTRILAKRVLLMDYITAARISGTSWPGIVFQHVLPNIWPTLVGQFRAAVRPRRHRRGLALLSRPRRAAAQRLLGPPAAGGAGHGLHRPVRRHRPGHRPGLAGHRRQPARRRPARHRRSDAEARAMSLLCRSTA